MKQYCTSRTRRIESEFGLGVEVHTNNLPYRPLILGYFMAATCNSARVAIVANTLRIHGRDGYRASLFNSTRNIQRRA